MMRYEFNTYRTSDKFLDIKFLFVETTPSNWRAYILTEINYQSVERERSELITIIHRLTESNTDMRTRVLNFIRENEIPYNRQTINYICWSSTVRSLESMREVAKTWSEITSYYIQHGGTFDTIQPLLKSRGIITL